jgi:hypothetical protein
VAGGRPPAHAGGRRLPDGRLVARRLVTIVRYPALGPAAESDQRNAPPDRAAGPFGLVVFGHGFAVTPEIYAALLRAWTRAGFVVAAQAFPLTYAHAPGGPDEADIINQPRDLRVVISHLLALSAHRGSALWKLIDPRDGSPSPVSQTAGRPPGRPRTLPAPGNRDRRVRAAVILSGAALPRIRPFSFPARSPPLLAVQGTADTTNRLYYTDKVLHPDATTQVRSRHTMTTPGTSGISRRDRWEAPDEPGSRQTGSVRSASAVPVLSPSGSVAVRASGREGGSLYEKAITGSVGRPAPVCRHSDDSLSRRCAAWHREQPYAEPQRDTGSVSIAPLAGGSFTT